MAREKSEQTKLMVAEITKLLQKEELWANAIAKKLKISPQMMSYYLKYHLLGKVVEVSYQEGNNKKLKLK